MIEDGVAEALAEEGLISHEYIGWAHLAGLQVADETFGLGEGSHFLNSKTFQHRGHRGSPREKTFLATDCQFDFSIEPIVRTSNRDVLMHGRASPDGQPAPLSPHQPAPPAC